MKHLIYNKTVKVPVSLQRLWDWHMNPGAFERLAPAWQKLLPLALPDSPQQGASVEFALKAGPFAVKWLARIESVEPPYRFIDTQEKGPFAYWRHEHLMKEAAPGQAVLDDKVTWSLPVGLGSIPFFRNRVFRELDRLFSFRHRRMCADLLRFPEALPGTGKTVLVTGSSGLVGQRLVPFLRSVGYSVRGLSRKARNGTVFQWDPARGWLDPEALEGVSAVIHLAGENIAGGRWTAERRKRILNSRVLGTRTLVDAMKKGAEAPAVLVCASGVNYYQMGPGARFEDAPKGDGFLSDVCREWETEAMQACSAGTRVVCMRTGVVLDPLGGALGKMLPAFRAGLGGRLGSGKQGFSWIAMDDLLDLYEWSIRDARVEGPLNAVHPELVTQADFSKILGSVLSRPAVLPLPEAVIRTLFGRMGEETLLADLTVYPAKAVDRGHRFRFKNLKDALSFMLGK